MIVAVGSPPSSEKITLFAAEDTVVVAENVIDTGAVLAKMKLLPVVVIEAPDVVMRFVPDKTPFIDTP